MSTALETAAQVRAGTASATKVVQAALERIDRLNPTLNAFTAVTRERALRKAAALDGQRAMGGPLGPLAGVPFAVKNLFDVAGLATLAGAKINAELPAATRDAVLVERLEAAGAVCVGALNMGEYAYDFTGRNSHFGASRNPHDVTRMTGGSSGGSGGAVGGNLVPVALGSDTNGSIRVPSSLCGIFGLKPTYGRLSRHRTFPFCNSLDHLGPFARNVADLAAIYDAMQGQDQHDAACTDRPAEPVAPLLGQGIRGLRIAVAGGYFAQGGEPVCFEAVANVAKALGATATVTVPEAARARAAAFLITSAEGANLHHSRLRSRAGDFDPETRDRFLAGALAPAAWYVQAQRFRRWYHARMLELFNSWDVILAPATPTTAPLVEQKTFSLDGVEMPVRANMGIYTQPISFIGLPVVAVPVVRPAGALPIGVQVIAAPWREDVALRVAAWLEREGVAVAPVARDFS